MESLKINPTRVLSRLNFNIDTFSSSVITNDPLTKPPVKEHVTKTKTDTILSKRFTKTKTERVKLSKTCP